MSKLWDLYSAGPLGLWMPERSEKKKITSKQAEWIIEHCNIINRPVVTSSIETVDTALQDDSWICTGQPIIFGFYSAEAIVRMLPHRDPAFLAKILAEHATRWIAVLLDGQNRLLACVNSGVPLTTWVHFGITNEKAFMAIDRGKPKSGASDMATMGEKSATALTAALVMLHVYLGGSRSTHLISSPKINTPDLLATLNAHLGLRDSVHWASAHRNKIDAAPRLVALVHYVAGMGNNPKVLARRDEFFDRLADGVNLAKDSPVLALRNRWHTMSEDELRKRGVPRALGVYTYLWTMIRAWNAFLMGHSKTKLQMAYKDLPNGKKGPADIDDIRSYFRKPNEATLGDDAIDAARP